MTHKSFRSLVFSGLLLLSGCTVRIDPPPGPFPSATAVSSSAGGDTALLNAEAVAGIPDVYKITTPAAITGASDLLYFEVVPTASAGLTLTLYDGQGKPLLEGDTADFFEAAGAVQQRVTPQAIGVAPVCRGPCTLLEPGEGAQVTYLEVVAAQGAVSYALYSYGGPFGDTSEPQNDQLESAVAVDGTVSGAVETVGDEDWYQSSRAVTSVTLSSAAAALALEAEIYLEDGTRFTSVPVGTPFTFPAAPQRFRVKVHATTDRAAAAGASTYGLAFE